MQKFIQLTQFEYTSFKFWFSISADILSTYLYHVNICDSYKSFKWWNLGSWRQWYGEESDFNVVFYYHFCHVWYFFPCCLLKRWGFIHLPDPLGIPNNFCVCQHILRPFRRSIQVSYPTGLKPCSDLSSVEIGIWQMKETSGLLCMLVPAHSLHQVSHTTCPTADQS